MTNLDDLPITREWLLSIGGENVESSMGPRYSDHVSFAEGIFQVWDFNGQHWLIEGYDHFPLTTRRQFRLLCEVFGIPIKKDD